MTTTVVQATALLRTSVGILNNVGIEHEKVGKIIQDGGSAVDDGEMKSDHQKHLSLDFGLSLPSPIHL